MLKRSFLAVLALLVAVAWPAVAAEGTDIHGGAAPVPMAAPLDRTTIANDVIATFRGEVVSRGWDLDAWESDMKSALSRATDGQLLGVKLATSLDGARQALAARVSPLTLGDDATDLVYFPLTPCRILDTRYSTGYWVGPWAASSDHYLAVNGSNMSAQGGLAGNCGAPVDPAAVVVSFIAVSPGGPGDLRIYPMNGTVPNASALNYANVGAGLNIANTAIVPVCQICGYDIRIQVDVSATHVIGDIVGYFWKPSAFPKAGRAYTHWYSSMVVADTKGFSSISNPSTGIYCLVPSVDVSNATPVVTVDYSASSATTVGMWRSSGIGCASGEMAIYLFNSSTGAAQGGGFTVFVP